MPATLFYVGASQDEQLHKRVNECVCGFTFQNFATTTTARLARSRLVSQKQDVHPYHRRPMACCCIRAGDTDGGGLDMLRPVAGLMMGMALRARVAEGWWSFKPECWLWYVGGMNAGEVELRENGGATVMGCCVGELCGELLASDDRSEDELCIDTRSLSVNNPGQNSISSSKSKDRQASNFIRKLFRDTDSVSSFILLTPRNCLCGFWETDSLGALRFRPP